MKQLLTFVLALFCSQGLIAQNNSQAFCANDQVLAHLDFWIGEWDVFDANNNQVGTNSISRILKSCAIQENWTDNQGGKGMSIFFKEPNSQKLKQLWVTEYALFAGGTKEKATVTADPGKSIRFQGTYPRQGQQILDRTTLTKESEDQVRQVIEISTDNGANWRTTFVGIYKRQK